MICCPVHSAEIATFHPSDDRGSVVAMGALSDLWKSERGLVAIALIIAATVLTAISIMTVDAWYKFTLIIYGTYAAAKTTTGAVALWKQDPPPKPGDAGDGTGPATPGGL